MKTSFKNIIQILDYYNDEDKCKQLLEQQRWHGKPFCPHCGHTKVYRTKAGFKCASPECYKKFSVTVGTIFENSKIKLRYWFSAIYLITSHKKGISSYQLARDLGITQKTAWFINHRVREMLKSNNSTLLSNMVEVDETFIGGKNKNRHYNKRVKGNTGRSVIDKTPVVGLLERNGNVKAFSVTDTSSKSLDKAINANVKLGTKVYTDEWTGYSNVRLKYNHSSINHITSQYVLGDVHVNNLEGFWSILKRGIYGIYHQVSPKHIDRYCVEFSYRYNTRELKDVDRFYSVLTHSTRRLKYKDLIKSS